MTKRDRTFDVLNILTHFHAFPDEVSGAYCLVECLVPVGAGAPPNRHAGETEGFFVLDGAVVFTIDGVEQMARTGAFVPIPDGAVHAFRAVGDRPARILVLNAPGHMHAAFFSQVGKPLPLGQTTLPVPSVPDVAAVMAVAQQVGMTILPPAHGGEATAA